MRLHLRDKELTWRCDDRGVYRAGDWYIHRSGRWYRLRKYGTDLNVPGTLYECKFEAQRRENMP